MTEFEGHINKLQSLYNSFNNELNSFSSDKNSYQVKTLEIIIEIEEEIKQIIENRKKINSVDEGLIILKRFQSLFKIKILDIVELLDKVIERLENDIISDSISLGFEIFPVSEKQKKIKSGLQKNKIDRGLKSENKFGLLIKGLLEKNINLDNLVVYEEAVNKSKNRHFPYKIVHLIIDGNKKTIVISNQIGEATFVYNGLVDVKLFKKYSKPNAINGFKGHQIIYGDDYYNKLMEVIFKKSKNDNINESGIININDDLIEKYGLKTILQYRRDLENIEEELKIKANIYKINGKWFLGDAKGHLHWPYINGKNLRNFPNADFNRQNLLSDKSGKITNPDSLKELFILLGMEIIDEKEAYKAQLESVEEELKIKANIYKVNGKWFFGEAKGSPNWPYINGKLLKNFPNKKFNKENGLGDKTGVITSIKYLKNLFMFLGMEVID